MFPRDDETVSIETKAKLSAMNKRKVQVRDLEHTNMVNLNSVNINIITVLWVHFALHHVVFKVFVFHFNELDGFSLQFLKIIAHVMEKLFYLE